MAAQGKRLKAVVAACGTVLTVVPFEKNVMFSPVGVKRCSQLAAAHFPHTWFAACFPHIACALPYVCCGAYIAFWPSQELGRPDALRFFSENSLIKITVETK